MFRWKRLYCTYVKVIHEYNLFQEYMILVTTQLLLIDFILFFRPRAYFPVVLMFISVDVFNKILFKFKFLYIMIIIVWGSVQRTQSNSKICTYNTLVLYTYNTLCSMLALMMTIVDIYGIKT